MKSTHSEAYGRAIVVLISARKALGIRQMDLAVKLGKPQSFVSKFESRERRLDIAEFVEICHALGVNPVTLLRQAELITEDDISKV